MIKDILLDALKENPGMRITNGINWLVCAGSLKDTKPKKYRYEVYQHEYGQRVKLLLVTSDLREAVEELIFR